MKNIFLFFFLIQYSLSNASDLQQKINQYLTQIHQASAAPGFSVVVVKNDQIIFQKGYGVERMGSKKSMTATTSTAIGSLTKSFTAMAIMQLVEKGKLDLEQTVAYYIPEFSTANKILSDQITVRMLLNNTSGLYGGISKRADLSNQSYERLLKVFQSVYLKRPPGSSYEYSNTAFSLAGLLISRVSGMAYEEYIERNILTPLKMNRSAANPAKFEQLQVLNGHNFGLEKGIPASAPIYSSEMLAAGSAMRCSAADLGNYLIALLNKGRFQGRQLINPKSITAMWLPNIAFQGLSKEEGGDGKPYHYGLGWMISDINGRKIIHHGGSTGTMSSFTMIDPNNRIAASILVNLDYNFIDKYRYQPLESIINNLLHLVADEPLSDYAQKRSKDKSRNDYQLPLKKRSNYVDAYRMQGGGDAWFMYGAKLEIIENNDGKLKGILKRGQEILQHFELDFLSPSQAVNRNIATPNSIQFQLKNTGEVVSVFLAGAKFTKITPSFLDQYQLHRFQEHQLYLPKTWQVLFKSDQPQLWKGANGMQIQPLECVEDKAAVDLVKTYLYSYQITDIGRINTETQGQFLWQQQSFISTKANQEYQHLVLQEISGRSDLCLLVTGERGQLDWKTVKVLLETLE